MTQVAFALLPLIVALLLTGCGTTSTPRAESKQREERAASEREEAIRALDNEVRLKIWESARSVRERAYCAPSAETLGNLYEVLRNQGPERAAAIADLTGKAVLEPKTKIRVLKLRPLYQGIGANLVRLARTGRVCYVANTALPRPGPR